MGSVGVLPAGDGRAPDCSRRVRVHRCDNRPVRELRDRVAVVTGAASGIGLAIVEAFVDEGMRVVMADLDEVQLHSHAVRLSGNGADVLAVPADVRDPESVDAVGRSVIEHFGTLHVAVNNAGVVGGGNSWEIPLDEWHRVIDVDLWGVIHGVRTFVPLILASGEDGHIVNVASMAAVLTLPRLAPYTVAKHGVLGLTDVLRLELEGLGAPVGASVVMPGMVRTAMNPIGTVEPAVVAANVLDAIRHGRAYVFTDDHSTADVERRLVALQAARGEVIT
jgi:NAD(P)-dependent dehydrogenase (short-subunit alcohol dehydrogenase family)